MFDSALSSFKYNMRITEHQSNKIIKVTLQALFILFYLFFVFIFVSNSYFKMCLHFRFDEAFKQIT